MAKTSYRVVLQPDDNDTLLVTCPDLPEVTTYGEDEADALLRARDAIEEALAARIADRQEIPRPSNGKGPRAELPVLTALKIELYRAVREERIRKAELGRRLGMQGPQIDRLFDLRHASQLSQLEAAFRALGRRVVIEVERA